MSFLKSLFSKEEETKPSIPEIMGLRIGCSFELDSLLLRIIDEQLVTENINATQIIEAVGVVDLEDTTLMRFYTDDDAFLQVVVQGALKEENIVDVKLFHYYNTLNVSNVQDWNALLKSKIGTPTYQLEDHDYKRVWESTGEYHPPIAMTEKTYDENGDHSSTDQFTMLFEREIDADTTEALFLSAEESFDEHNNVSRCFVISTGMTLSPSNISIHG